MEVYAAQATSTATPAAATTQQPILPSQIQPIVALIQQQQTLQAQLLQSAQAQPQQAQVVLLNTLNALLSTRLTALQALTQSSPASSLIAIETTYAVTLIALAGFISKAVPQGMQLGTGNPVLEATCLAIGSAYGNLQGYFYGAQNAAQNASWLGSNLTGASNQYSQFVFANSNNPNQPIGSLNYGLVNVLTGGNQPALGFISKCQSRIQTALQSLPH